MTFSPGRTWLRTVGYHQIDERLTALVDRVRDAPQDARAIVGCGCMTDRAVRRDHCLRNLLARGRCNRGDFHLQLAVVHRKFCTAC